MRILLLFGFPGCCKHLNDIAIREQIDFVEPLVDLSVFLFLTPILNVYYFFFYFVAQLQGHFFQELWSNQISDVIQLFQQSSLTNAFRLSNLFEFHMTDIMWNSISYGVIHQPDMMWNVCLFCHRLILTERMINSSNWRTASRCLFLCPKRRVDR